MCAASWCDLDLILELVVVTISFKILSGLFLGFRKVRKIDTWYSHWLGCLCVYHDMTFTLALPECVYLPCLNHNSAISIDSC